MTAHDYTGNLEAVQSAIATVVRRLDRVDGKTDKLLEQSAAQTEHLKALNGQVVKNVSALAGQSRAIERNTTSLSYLSERSKEHRLFTDREHEELIQLRISAKGEEVEQDHLQATMSWLRKNALSVMLGISQAVIVWILIEHFKQFQ